MRVLFVTPFYYPEQKFGGPPRKIHSMAKGLLAPGHHVGVVTFDSTNRESKDCREIHGINVQYLPWVGQGLRQFPLKRDLLTQAIGRCDVVHCYGLYNLICPVGVRFARKLERPVVLEPLGMYPPRARNQFAKRIYNCILTKRIVDQAAALIAASEAEAAELGAIADPRKIVVRRNGIDLEAFNSLPSGRPFREKWGIKDDERIILFIGRLSPIKNLEQFLTAFQRANVKSAKVVLVGPSEREYNKILRELVERQDLSERVIFAGPLYEEDQKAALAAADLFVLPSLNESFGNAAGEAVAANVPVLLTETCGIAPLIHKRAGLAVPLGVDSLAEGMRIMLDPVKRERFLVNRETVKRDLSWDEPIRQTEALYQRLIAEDQMRSRRKDQSLSIR